MDDKEKMADARIRMKDMRTLLVDRVTTYGLFVIALIIGVFGNIIASAAWEIASGKTLTFSQFALFAFAAILVFIFSIIFFRKGMEYKKVLNELAILMKNLETIEKQKEKTK